jgi:putative oxidoreductase
MAVAAFVGGHVGNGFFMNWTGHQVGEGFEFHILAVALALAVVIRGSGALSLDRLLIGREG